MRPYRTRAAKAPRVVYKDYSDDDDEKDAASASSEEDESDFKDSGASSSSSLSDVDQHGRATFAMKDSDLGDRQDVSFFTDPKRMGVKQEDEPVLGLLSSDHDDCPKRRSKMIQDSQSSYLRTDDSTRMLDQCSHNVPAKRAQAASDTDSDTPLAQLVCHKKQEKPKLTRVRIFLSLHLRSFNGLLLN